MINDSIWKVTGNSVTCMLNEKLKLQIDKLEDRIVFKVRDENKNILYTKYITNLQFGLINEG